MQEENIPSHLIIRYLSNEATSEEQEELIDWVARDGEHQRIFNEWLTAWNKEVPMESTFELSRGLENLNKRIDALENAPDKTIRLFSLRNIAAVITVFLVAGVSAYFLKKYSASKDSQQITEQVTTSGQKLTVTLSDGSVVKLNSNTILRYPKSFEADSREVYLTGEAFFDVKKDSLRPFRIHTGELTTQVLGTSFNVKHLQDVVTVCVATGKVSVSNGIFAEQLLPSEKADYSRTTKKIIKAVTNLDNELAWKENIIVFDDTSLNDAALTLEAWYGVKVIFDNDALKHCVITGKFDAMALEKVLHAISFSTGMQFSVTDNVVRLSGSGCE